MNQSNPCKLKQIKNDFFYTRQSLDTYCCIICYCSWFCTILILQRKNGSPVGMRKGLSFPMLRTTSYADETLHSPFSPFKELRSKCILSIDVTQNLQVNLDRKISPRFSRWVYQRQPLGTGALFIHSPGQDKFVTEA